MGVWEGDLRVRSTVDVNLQTDAVCKRLGYGDRTPPASTISLIESQMQPARELIKPVYLYEVKTIEGIIGHEISLSDSIKLTSKTISYVMDGCLWMVVLLVTIGPSIDDQIDRYQKAGDLLRATILDALGTEAVAQASYYLQDVIKNIAKVNGFQATIRYSPGYCDWDVSQQKLLFQLIDAGSLDVTLTEDCLMTPRKSISGINGIGEISKGKKPPCIVFCTQRDTCTHKRQQWDPEVQGVLE